MNHAPPKRASKASKSQESESRVTVETVTTARQGNPAPFRGDCGDVPGIEDAYSQYVQRQMPVVTQSTANWHDSDDFSIVQ